MPVSESRDVLTCVVEDGIATLSIERPAARNALNVAVANGLTSALSEIEARDDVRVVILTSSDCGTFCAGLDLKEAARLRAAGDDILTQMKDPFQHRLANLRVPVIAAMTGHVIAGGMMLSLQCDLRVAMAGTEVGITEVRVGRGSPWAAPLLWMLPQPILSQLLLTGDLMSIERLADLGFINFVEADADAVRRRARDLAERIRDNAPLSVEAAKAMMRLAADSGRAAALEQAEALYQPVYASEDAVEGPLAFAEARKPHWKGR